MTKEILSMKSENHEGNFRKALGLECYYFAEVLDSMAYIDAVDRATFMVNNINKIKKYNQCNIEKVVDVALLLSLPWITFSEKTFELYQLLENIDDIY
jgi:hypothetical protein